MNADLSRRQIQLLQVVDDGGLSDARSIDLAMSARSGPSEKTVRAELLQLHDAGLVTVDADRGVGGMWAIASLGRNMLDRLP